MGFQGFSYLVVWLILFGLLLLLFAEKNRNDKDKTVSPILFMQVKQFCFTANTNGSAAVQNGFPAFAILKY